MGEGVSEWRFHIYLVAGGCLWTLWVHGCSVANWSYDERGSCAFGRTRQWTWTNHLDSSILPLLPGCGDSTLWKALYEELRVKILGIIKWMNSVRMKVQGATSCWKLVPAVTAVHGTRVRNYCGSGLFHLTAAEVGTRYPLVLSYFWMQRC